MAKVLAVDYGGKRCGVAETDELQIIASSLATVATAELLPFLERLIAKQPIEALVVGLPKRMSGQLSEIEGEIQKFIAKFKKAHPTVPVERSMSLILRR